jgi:hypothetical protein
MSEATGAADLLSIDVVSELAKLARARAPSPDHVPAECVRRALWAGARSVDVRLRNGQLEIEDDAAPVPPAMWRELARLLDETRPLPERHAALVTLEGSPQAPLVSLSGARRLTLEALPGSGRSVLRAALPGLRPGPAAARVATLARHARARVSVDGRPVDHGFAAALARSELSPPLRGAVALVPGQEDAQLWLLSGGAVVTRATLPGRPPLTAALELGAPGGYDLTAAALRELALPLEAELLRQAAALLAAVSSETRVWSAPDQAWYRRAVLAAVAAGCPGLAHQPLLPAIRSGTAPRLVPLQRLARAAKGGPVAALFPDQPPESFRLGSQLTFVLDAAERGRLAALYGARFVTPTRRSRARALERLGGLPARARRVGLAALSRLLPPPRDAVPAAALTAEERRLGRGLRAVLSLGVGFRSGTASAALRRGRLWLSRGHPTVRSAVARVARDEGWLPVAALALAPPWLPGAPSPGPLDAAYLLDSLRPSAYPADRLGDDLPPGVGGGARLSASKEKPT